MVLICELVKALNLYSNLGLAQNSNLKTNSNARVASKKFWMQKAQSNWVFLTWSLCFIALLFVTIFCFCFFAFLVFALHNIHAFHSRFVFVISFQKKKQNKTKKRTRESKCVLHYLSWVWNQGWPIYFYITCLWTLFSLDELTYCTLLVEAL